jgi:hypothetical protein
MTERGDENRPAHRSAQAVPRLYRTTNLLIQREK